MFDAINRIIVIKLRHIGDVLLAVPAIRALKETFPGASITALVNSGTEDMLSLNPLVDSVIPFDRKIKGQSMLGRAGKELSFVRALRARSFDMTVDLTGGDRPAILGFLSGARYRLGYRPKGGFAGKRLLYTHLAEPPSYGTHTVLRDLGVVRPFGIDTRNLAVDIHASKEDDAFVSALLAQNAIGRDTPFVHVHPTSRWMFKGWSDEGMAFVLDRIQEHGLRVVLTAGPADVELKKVRSIISMMETKPVDLSGRLKLKHLVGLSARAAFFFGVDSAPMHIAAATGIRVVALFGPSGAFDWGPWPSEGFKKEATAGGFNSPYPARGGVQYSGGNIVIQKDWQCVPCGKDGCGGTKRSRCLDELDGKYVWSIIKEAFGLR